MAADDGLEARVKSLETWTTGHDRLCAERYRNLDSSIAGVVDGQKNMSRLGLTVLLAICGWLAIQVYGYVTADKQVHQVAVEAAAQAVKTTR